MNIEEKPCLNDKELRQLLRLWNVEYPGHISYGDIDELVAYLEKVDPDRHCLITDQKSIRAWMTLFQREQATWLAMIVDSRVQGMGLGSSLIDHAKNKCHELNAWVIDHDRYSKFDGSPYRSPLDFYLKQGFVVCPEDRLENDKMSAVKVRWTQGILH